MERGRISWRVALSAVGTSWQLAGGGGRCTLHRDAPPRNLCYHAMPVHCVPALYLLSPPLRPAPATMLLRMLGLCGLALCVCAPHVHVPGKSRLCLCVPRKILSRTW